jgi:hypothetical protein
MDKIMDLKAIIDQRMKVLYAEFSDARAKLRIAVREMRMRRQRVNEINAQLIELHSMSSALERAEEADVESIDSETGSRVSAMILYFLEKARPDGLTLAQLSEALGPIKKSTISATLYNLKKRREIDHIEATGRYRLATLAANSTRGFFPAK